MEGQTERGKSTAFNGPLASEGAEPSVTANNGLQQSLPVL